MSVYGKKVWYIPDGYYPDSERDGKYVSHEAICVLNASDNDANLKITLYFEDTEPMKGFVVECKAKRTNHIRMDQLQSIDGKTVPRGVAYAILVESSADIICQYSRVDTAQENMSFMTTIAY